MMIAKATHNNRTWLIVSLILGLIVALLVAYVLYAYDYVEGKPTYSLTPEATVNRFLASERLLQAEHKKVHISKGESAKTALDEMWQQPSDQAKRNAVMLYSVSKSQEASLPDMLKWVEKGGHLVTFSQDTLHNVNDIGADSMNEAISEYRMNENVLLTYLGVHHVTNEYRNKDKSPEPLKNENKQLSNPRSKLLLDNKVIMRLPKVVDNRIDPAVSVETVINTKNNTHLNTQQFWDKYPKAQPWADYNWVNDNGQPVAPTQTVLTANQLQQLIAYLQEQEKKYNPSLQADEVMFDVKLGEGRITIFNSSEIFTNPNSKNLQQLASRTPKTSPTDDFWQMLQVSEITPNNAENIANLDNAYLLKYLMADRQQIWIVPDIDVPSLPVMLWRSAKWACVAFLLLIAVGMLALPKRFGRVRSYQTDTQRNIFGYFDHVGQYLWHTDEAKALVTQNRTRLIEQIIAKQPQYARLEPDQLCQAISEQLNIGKSAVKQGLYNDWHTADQFLQCTRQFAVIRQAYS